MLATGVGFAVATGFWPILLVAFAGTLNPSMGDVTIFLPTEQALLARAVEPGAPHGALRPLQRDRKPARRRSARSRVACRSSSSGSGCSRSRRRCARPSSRTRSLAPPAASCTSGFASGAHRPRRRAPALHGPSLGRAAWCSSSPRSSASTPSAAASPCSRSSRCGSSCASTCRSPRPARCSSRRACSPRSRSWHRRRSRDASGWCGRWPTRTSRRTAS